MNTSSDLPPESPSQEIPVETPSPLGDKYLRNRPFLLVYYSHTPRKGVVTSVKGWATVADHFDVQERKVVVDRVSNRQLLDADLIVDIFNKTVVKNRYPQDSELSATEFAENILNRYSLTVRDGVMAWSRNKMASA